MPALPTDTAAASTENGANGQPVCGVRLSHIHTINNVNDCNVRLLTTQFDGDSDNDSRRHHPSSNPRTQFTAQTPATEKAAIQNLKTKMTFSDHSVSWKSISILWI